MAFNGYLIKLGGSTGVELPMKYIKYETYKITPNQRLDLDTTRDTTGMLHRNVLSHTAMKVEFETIPMDNYNVAALMTLLRNSFSDSQARKVTLDYYDVETDAYKTGTFYMPDIQWTIRNVDLRNSDHKVINYNGARLAFIEY